MLKKMIFVMALAYSMLSVLSAAETPAKKPNIVFIMSDDQGNWALGKKNQEMITPHLDKLCEQGVMFTNFFCASPVCSPARMSIFTGKLPSAHGVHDWLGKGHINESDICDEDLVNFKKQNREWYYNSYIRGQVLGDKAIRFLDGHTTYSELLAKNGYQCGFSGKWHVGDANNPHAGFTFFATQPAGGGHYYCPVVREQKTGKMKMQINKYATDDITDHALEFLDTVDGEKPFYLSVHYTAPHAAWDRNQHPAEVYKLYENCKFETMPNLPAHKWAKEKTRHNKNHLRGFFTAVTAMDKGIGDIVKKLEAKGLRENTIIIFTADNGINMGHNGIYGKGNGTSPMNMYENSVKVPAIVSCPARFVSNVENNEMLSHCDWMPTFLELAEINYTPPAPLPGKSFKKLLEGENEKLHNIIAMADEYGPVRMWRTNDYKLIYRYGFADTAEFQEFYDLKNDADETTNLYTNPDQQTRIAEMKKQMEEYFPQFSTPEFDGKQFKVRGNGQNNRVTIDGNVFR